MSEINKSNNHCAKNYDVNTIKKENNDTKLDFIRNLLSQTEIPENFAPTWRIGNKRRIFFRIKDGKEYKREWVLFDENKFYCAYCLCFALNDSRFVKGFEHSQGCRITDLLNKHEQGTYHILAKKTFLKHDSAHQQDITEAVSAKRNVLRTLIKIIIFIATHG